MSAEKNALVFDRNIFHKGYFANITTETPMSEVESRFKNIIDHIAGTEDKAGLFRIEGNFIAQSPTVDDLVKMVEFLNLSLNKGIELIDHSQLGRRSLAEPSDKNKRLMNIVSQLTRSMIRACKILETSTNMIQKGDTIRESAHLDSSFNLSKTLLKQTDVLFQSLILENATTSLAQIAKSTNYLIGMLGDKNKGIHGIQEQESEKYLNKFKELNSLCKSSLEGLNANIWKYFADIVLSANHAYLSPDVKYIKPDNLQIRSHDGTILPMVFEDTVLGDILARIVIASHGRKFTTAFNEKQIQDYKAFFEVAQSFSKDPSQQMQHYNILFNLLESIKPSADKIYTDPANKKSALDRLGLYQNILQNVKKALATILETDLILEEQKNNRQSTKKIKAKEKEKGNDSGKDISSINATGAITTKTPTLNTQEQSLAAKPNVVVGAVVGSESTLEEYYKDEWTDGKKPGKPKVEQPINNTKPIMVAGKQAQSTNTTKKPTTTTATTTAKMLYSATSHVKKGTSWTTVVTGIPTQASALPAEIVKESEPEITPFQKLVTLAGQKSTSANHPPLNIITLESLETKLLNPTTPSSSNDSASFFSISTDAEVHNNSVLDSNSPKSSVPPEVKEESADKYASNLTSKEKLLWQQRVKLEPQGQLIWNHEIRPGYKFENICSIINTCEGYMVELQSGQLNKTPVPVEIKGNRMYVKHPELGYVRYGMDYNGVPSIEIPDSTASVWERHIESLKNKGASETSLTK